MYKQLQDVDRLKNELEGDTNTLKNDLNDIKNDLSTIMTDCAAAGVSTQCGPIQAIHDSLNVNIDFTTLPDTTAELNNLKTAIDFDLTGNIKIVSPVCIVASIFFNFQGGCLCFTQCFSSLYSQDSS